MQNQHLIIFATVFLIIGSFLGTVTTSLLASRRIRRANIEGYRECLRKNNL